MAKAPQFLPIEFVEIIADAIRILGHPLRIRIVEVLDLHGETQVNKIVDLLGCSQSVASQHLNKMRRAGLIAARREGSEVFYSLVDEHPCTIVQCMREKYDQLKKKK